MKKTWIHGLALSVGVTSLPSVVSAQYTIGQNNGLGASSFQLPPLPPRPASAGPTQAALAAYAQQSSAIGSGVQDHVHVPQQLQLPVPAAVQPSQYQSQQYGAPPASQPYENVGPVQQHSMQPTQPMAPQTIYSTPPQATSPGISSNCPACASGQCSAHGTGHVNAGNAVPNYGASYGSYGQSFGATDYVDCGVGGSSAIALTPSVVSPQPWIFGASGLLVNRFDDSSRRLASNGDNGIINTSAARMRASGGLQGSIGHYFGCGRYALVGTYWGVFGDEQMRLYTPGAGAPIRTDLPFTQLNIGLLAGPAVPSWYGAYMPGGVAPRPLYDVFDSGSTSWGGNPNGNDPALHTQRIRRDNEIHNVELNLFSFALGGGARQAYAGGGCGGGGLGGGGLGGGGLGGGYGGAGNGSCGDPCGSNCSPCETSCAPRTGPTGPCAPWYGAQCSKLRLNTFGGVRWFRFGDEFEYAASPTNNTFTDANDVYFNSNVTNDLVGFQLGTLGTWCTGSRINLFGGTNFGIYNNHIRTSQRIGTTTTDAMIRTLGGADVAYNFNNTANDVAFIGEGTVGTGFRLSRGLTMNLGYRVTGVSGIATAVGQIPTTFTHPSEINSIHNDRSLILHGAVFGANYNF